MLIALAMLVVGFLILATMFGIVPAIIIFVLMIIFCCGSNSTNKYTDYDEIKNDYITNGDLKNCNKTEKIGKGFNKYED